MTTQQQRLELGIVANRVRFAVGDSRSARVYSTMIIGSGVNLTVLVAGPDGVERDPPVGATVISGASGSVELEPDDLRGVSEIIVKPATAGTAPATALVSVVLDPPLAQNIGA